MAKILVTGFVNAGLRRQSTCVISCLPFMAVGYISGCRVPEKNDPDSSRARDCLIAQQRLSAAGAKLPSSVRANDKSLNLMMPEAPVAIPSSQMTEPLSGPESGSNLITIDDVKAGTVALTFNLTFSDKESERGICTGVIAGKNFVLTAAHCFAPPSGKAVEEFSGNVIVAPRVDYSTSGSLIFEVAHVAIHPEWNGLHHDIAVVFVKNNFRDEWKAVSVARKTSETAQNTPVVLVGYGITGDEKSDAGVARHGESWVHSLINKVNYPELSLVNQLRIKGSPATSAGACTGDSGGPAFLKNSGLLLGIVSGMNLAIQSNLDCRSRDSNYTIIEPYLDWIESVTGQKLLSGNTLTQLKDLAPAQISASAVSPKGLKVKRPEQGSFVPKSGVVSDAALKQKQGAAPKSEDAAAVQDPCASR